MPRDTPTIYIDDATSLTCIAESLVKAASHSKGAQAITLLVCANMLLDIRKRQIEEATCLASPELKSSGPQPGDAL
jgi:hypothetical protein